MKSRPSITLESEAQHSHSPVITTGETLKLFSQFNTQFKKGSVNSQHITCTNSPNLSIVFHICCAGDRKGRPYSLQ